MPKIQNVAEINYTDLRDAAANWAGLIATLTAHGWEIEPDTTGPQLARIMVALVNSATAEEEEAPDPLVDELANAYWVYGLDEPPLAGGIQESRDRNEIAATVAARHPASRWGLQHGGEG